MAHSGENGSSRLEPTQGASARLRRRVARLCHGVWFLVTILELALLARLVAVLIYGAQVGWTSTQPALNEFYAITNPIVRQFEIIANFQMPYPGIAHAFDTGTFLAMDFFFFAALGSTKLGLWAASRWSRPRLRYAPCGPLEATAPSSSQRETARVPVEAASK